MANSAASPDGPTGNADKPAVHPDAPAARNPARSRHSDIQRSASHPFSRNDGNQTQCGSGCRVLTFSASIRRQNVEPTQAEFITPSVHRTTASGWGPEVVGPRNEHGGVKKEIRLSTRTEIDACQSRPRQKANAAASTPGDEARAKAAASTFSTLQFLKPSSRQSVDSAPPLTGDSRSQSRACSTGSSDRDWSKRSARSIPTALRSIPSSRSSER